MISNRQVHIIWLQGMLWSAKESSCSESVVFPHEEISVVANLHGQVHFDIFSWNQAFLL